MSSFGSDGASVITGRSGVATRLQRLNSNLVSICCVAHCLALPARQASEAIPYLTTFKGILSSLFHYYHNSPVWQTGLPAIQTLLGDHVLCLKQAKDACWLSHQAAVDALCRSLSSMLKVLDRDAAEREPIASGLLLFMQTHSFPVTLC